MKLIIIEGGDRLGKSSLIKGLCEHFNYDNVIIRHFGKPPKDLLSEAALGFQIKTFYQEAELFLQLENSFTKMHSYYDNVVIWNRAHLGEYVYGQMFRNSTVISDYPNFIKKQLLTFEKLYFSKLDDVYLITLTADPGFFCSKEDGNSFSKNLKDKTKELELFKEAHNFSLIPNKLLVKVDKQITELYYNGSGQFRPKEDILNEVIKFIENGSRK